MSSLSTLFLQSSDITTEAGKEQATSGTSALSKYLQQLQNSQRDVMESLYTSAIDRPCLHACDNNDALDHFLSCRQPLSFFSFGRHDPREEDTTIEIQMPTPGAYAIPSSCEYCGAEHTSLCDPKTCTRPVLFFRKQRPPFCQTPTNWDPVTEYEVDTAAKLRVDTRGEVENTQERPGSAQSWMGAFFSGRSTPTSKAEDTE